MEREFNFLMAGWIKNWRLFHIFALFLRHPFFYIQLNNIKNKSVSIPLDWSNWLQWADIQVCVLLSDFLKYLVRFRKEAICALPCCLGSGCIFNKKTALSVLATRAGRDGQVVLLLHDFFSPSAARSLWPTSLSLCVYAVSWIIIIASIIIARAHTHIHAPQTMPI